MRVLRFLEEVNRVRPEGVVSTGIGALVYEVGPENRKEELLELTNRVAGGALWRENGRAEKQIEADPEPGLVIDLAGVGVISPSVASAIAATAAEVVREWKVPVVATNVGPEVVKSLAECRYIRENPVPPILVLDRAGAATYIGAMPDRWRIVLENLPEGGASASALAGPASTNKRDVNRFSVYLQELHLNGLARREKVPGSEREDAERGWTYVYHPIRRPPVQRGRTDEHSLDARVEVA